MIQPILAIVGLSAIAVAVTYYFIKKGKIQDTDGDFIPDVVEDTVEEIKEFVEETEEKIQAVKEEFQDVKDSIKEVVKQSKDVVDAAKGKKRRGRKPKNKK